jgi:hypothetical protein
MLTVWHRMAAAACLLMLAACTADRMYTGKVVDTHGRPVAGARVFAGFSPPEFAQHEVSTQTNRHGEFSIDLDTFSLDTAGKRPRYIEASSRDGKRYALLSTVAPANNVLVLH